MWLLAVLKEGPKSGVSVKRALRALTESRDLGRV